MKKKIISALLLCVVMICSLVGCGNEKSKKNDNESDEEGNEKFSISNIEKEDNATIIEAYKEFYIEYYENNHNIFDGELDVDCAGKLIYTNGHPLLVIADATGLGTERVKRGSYVDKSYVLIDLYFFDYQNGEVVKMQRLPNLYVIDNLTVECLGGEEIYVCTEDIFQKDEDNYNQETEGYKWFVVTRDEWKEEYPICEEVQVLTKSWGLTDNIIGIGYGYGYSSGDKPCLASVDFEDFLDFFKNYNYETPLDFKIKYGEFVNTYRIRKSDPVFYYDNTVQYLYISNESLNGGYSSVDYRVDYYRKKGIDVEVGDLMWYIDGAKEYDETRDREHNRKDILKIVKEEIYGHKVVNYNYDGSEFTN